MKDLNIVNLLTGAAEVEKRKDKVVCIVRLMKVALRNVLVDHADQVVKSSNFWTDPTTSATYKWQLNFSDIHLSSYRNLEHVSLLFMLPESGTYHLGYSSENGAPDMTMAYPASESLDDLLQLCIAVKGLTCVSQQLSPFLR